MKNRLQIYLAALMVGLLTGAACSVFLWLLKLVTEAREELGFLHYFLPLAALGVAALYRSFGQEVERGNNLILDEIHEPKMRIPFKLAPLILISTVWTHLFGGSAGREGSAVQMGGAFSDWVATNFKGHPRARRGLLIAGLGAGFGAAIGVPWAGVIFGHEVLNERGFEFTDPIPTMVATLSAHYITHLLQAPHTLYPTLPPLSLSVGWLGAALIAGLVFGSVAFLFSALMHWSEQRYKAIPYHPLLKITLAGALLALLFSWAPASYQGLGLETIIKAIETPAGGEVFALKLLLTVATLAIGMKGGEFTPLVFIGATLGSALAAPLGVPTYLLAVLGFAAVFGAAARTPLACALMICELFTLTMAPYALVACLSATLCARLLSSRLPHRPRLYQGQRLK